MGFLLPAFAGTKIEPMDFDAVTERYGRFLIFETKAPGVKIKTGQRITLENIVLLGRGKVIVIILYGKTEFEIQGGEQWYYSNEDGRPMCIKREISDCNADKIVRMTEAWLRLANEAHQ